MNSALRPKFNPTLTGGQAEQEASLPCGWVSLIRCNASFPPHLFEPAALQLIHHPEYNSTLILRSETISDSTESAAFAGAAPIFEGSRPTRQVHRRLLPRRPGRDSGLEQICTLFASVNAEDPIPHTLVLTPLVKPGEELPYYHPAVHHLAFRYVTSPTSSENTLRIDVLPLPDTPTDPSSRLYRTALALLETVHRYGWGALTNYQKRVAHDNVLQRETYQDLYLVMRERHKHLVGTWQEKTDPRKHVFEVSRRELDIGIATFLMLLWKEMFPPSPEDLPVATGDTPWRSWGRPPGGFVDLGCGNGLLVHILTSEGYAGYGIDVRARQSWAHYPASTQAALRVHALDPTKLPPSPTSSSPHPSLSSSTISKDNPENVDEDPYLRPGTFIIGNHADELTPWVPVLATLHHASGYLSIPCCPWSFDERFQRNAAAPFPEPSSSEHASDDSEPAASLEADESDFLARLNLGIGSENSAYAAYRTWLARLSRRCGWHVECEMLRIPSTRNWSIVGRQREGDEEDAYRRAEAIVLDVRRRGAFKTRTPEGKAGDH
ncbi:DUF1613-domain-containing protein [Punctularia strigosozonata HHB-11173 SS5]|uniref:DUF1613-domain-containing protein n=1 Tax=Punctularia strigosozonata (strain HHB-11173) TaxID=741275 RepID=UPI0004417439|nr:DUF1613-domain-containing protein [Punctularia strigosozonata HHB-11173 SS5]EIN09314.1 DUF1613-domain-containing protein [Punctularia strigosozonata HHB-11173 SS5]